MALAQDLKSDLRLYSMATELSAQRKSYYEELNAASRESWKELCRADLFDRVGAGLRALHRAKRDQRALHPLPRPPARSLPTW